MIFLIDVCFLNFHRFEFIEPIENILQNKSFEYKVIKYKEDINNYINKYNPKKIIICGTALKDFDYLNYIKNFNFIKEKNIPVLGICAGAQIISSIFNCSLKNHQLIGKYKVQIIKENDLINKEYFYSYFLITKIPILNKNFEILGVTKNNISCFFKLKNKEIYCCLFHPEVLNPEIIINFLKI